MQRAVGIRFDGRQADAHVLDMRHFGEVLIGFERVTNYGLFALSERRFPRRGERFLLSLQAREPQPGSLELLSILQEWAGGVLPLFPELLRTMGSEVVWRWTSWVALMTGGRAKEADPHFTALMEFAREIHGARSDSEERMQQFLLEVLERALPYTKKMVTPVGSSAGQMTILSLSEEGDDLKTEIDIPVADAIRSRENLEVGDMETIQLYVDGIILHNRRLRVVLPDNPGRYIPATVGDPAFDMENNIYVQALAKGLCLEASVKALRRPDGGLHSLHVADARMVDDDAG